MNNFLTYKNYKLVVGFLFLFLAFFLLYKQFFNTKTEISYVLGKVEKGTIISTVSGAGQILSENQIDIKAKVSGDVVGVSVKSGDKVRSGQILAYLDSSDLRKSIVDAEATLSELKLEYQKASAQAPIDYEKSTELLMEAKTDLENTYNDTYTTISNVFLDLPAVVVGMQNTLYGYTLSGQNSSQWNVDYLKNNVNPSNTTVYNFAGIAENDYKFAKPKYDSALLSFKTLTRYSSPAELENLLTASIEATTAVAQTLQSELNLLDAVVDDLTSRYITVNTGISNLRANDRGYLTTVNATLSSLLSAQRTLESNKKLIKDREREIQIFKINNPEGSNPISLQSIKQSIDKQERTLQDLKRKLSDYVIFAPFEGVLASFNLKKLDSISSGFVTGTLITNQKIVQMSVSEVDVAKIHMNDKASITFDAIEDLTLTGQVVEIDALGAVSQGVATYKIKIAFDSQDSRIKPGMTANCNVQIAVKQNVLKIPTSAVKTQNNSSFVQVFESAMENSDNGVPIKTQEIPKQLEIKTGISDDSYIEVTEGLQENQVIIINVISSSTNSSQQGTNRSNINNFRSPGIRF